MQTRKYSLVSMNVIDDKMILISKHGVKINKLFHFPGVSIIIKYKIPHA